MQKQSDKFSFSLLTILAALALLVILIVLVTSFVKLIDRSIGGTPYENRDLVAERLEPYGRVNTGNLVSNEPKMKAPQEIYVSLCASCHDTGLNDAPLIGDNVAWSARFEERGLEGLHNSALHGRNLMPAKGGDPRLSDEEVIRTVDFILANSGIEVTPDDPAEDIVAEEAPTTAAEGETEAALEEKVDAEMVEQAAIKQQEMEEAIIEGALTKEVGDTSSNGDLVTDVARDVDNHVTEEKEKRVEVTNTPLITTQKTEDIPSTHTSTQEMAAKARVENDQVKSEERNIDEVDEVTLQDMMPPLEDMPVLESEEQHSIDTKATGVEDLKVNMPSKSPIEKATKVEVEQ